MIARQHPLLQASLGSQKMLLSCHFGAAQARPKVYIQASLHADELPGMLVAHHLRQRLEAAEAAGEIVGEVVLVPMANPLGLAQRLDHKALGRFELGSSENFNRHYPDLAAAVFERVRGRLGADAQANVACVRAAVAEFVQHWQPATELDSLRRTLLGLAHDADVVLDLHCDSEAVMHLYSEDACWPPLQPLAALLGCQAVLLARESGGGPLDERLSGLWWQLAERLRGAGVDVPLPQACASATVELRGETDVRHELAHGDAQALMAYLRHLGVLRGPLPAVPPLPCEPTPLSGSETLRSPCPGVLVFRAEPGQRLAVGEPVADVVDPLSGLTHEVQASVAGVFYARVRERYVHAGGEIGKIAGATPFRSGNLLGA